MAVRGGAPPAFAETLMRELAPASPNALLRKPALIVAAAAALWLLLGGVIIKTALERDFETALAAESQDYAQAAYTSGGENGH